MNEQTHNLKKAKLTIIGGWMESVYVHSAEEKSIMVEFVDSVIQSIMIVYIKGIHNLL